MKTLYVIPAREGSKRLPGKNMKPLAGKPLIQYSIECAREMSNDEDICVSTDDKKIIELVQTLELKVPFIRPAYLSTDNATSNDMLIHAIDFYKKQGIDYEAVILLQPTSPLRKSYHVMDAQKKLTQSTDMVVSVKESHSAIALCNEDNNGYLKMAINIKNKTRQNFDDFYQLNGAIYIIRTKPLLEYGLSNIDKKIKYVMEERYSVDIDSEADFMFAEWLINNERIDNEK